MSRTTWRIGTDTPDYEADNLGGLGAKATGGRWNEKGIAVLYTAESRALACLETVVHLNAGGLPLNRYLVEITIPDNVLAASESFDPGNLPVGWDAEPPGRASLSFGSDWLRSTRSPLLIVPSVIVPEELNFLINPNHPLAGNVTSQKVRKWTYDWRLRK